MAKPARSIPVHMPVVRKAQIRLMKTEYGESIGRINLLDSDSESDT